MENLGFIRRDSPEADRLWERVLAAFREGADSIPVVGSFTDSDSLERKRFVVRVSFDSAFAAAREAFLGAYYEELRRAIKRVNG